MPRRFNSRTTALPNSERPSLWKSDGASEFGSSTEHESALKIESAINLYYQIRCKRSSAVLDK